MPRSLRVTLAVSGRTLNHKRRRQDGHRVGTPSHRRCSGSSLDSGPSSVPIQKNWRADAETTSYPAEQSSGADGEQAGACSPPLTASVGHKTSNHKRFRQVVRTVPCRCSSPSAGFRHFVGAPAHGQCSSPWPVLKPIVGTHSPLSVPRQQNQAQASSTTLDSAQQWDAADGGGLRGESWAPCFLVPPSAADPWR